MLVQLYFYLTRSNSLASLRQVSHFQETCQPSLPSCYYQLKALWHIRHCLDIHTASLIAHALISSRLDYCNSVLCGAPQYVTHKLQRVQNSLARIFLPPVRQSSPLRTSSTASSLATCSQQNTFQTCHHHIYKALCTNSPQYLASYIRYHQSVRSLRSSDQHFLVPTPSSTNFGSRSFRHLELMHLAIRTSPTIDAFKRSLKTHLLPSCL